MHAHNLPLVPALLQEERKRVQEMYLQAGPYNFFFFQLDFSSTLNSSNFEGEVGRSGIHSVGSGTNRTNRTNR